MKRLVYREYQLKSHDGEFWYLSIRVRFLLLEKVMIPVILLLNGFPSGMTVVGGIVITNPKNGDRSAIHQCRYFPRVQI
jgi:hypothetical protein